jgi:hypothetical protein
MPIFCLVTVINISRAHFVAEAHIPLASVTENQAFAEMLAILDSSYQLPSRSTLRNIILNEAKELKEKV